MKLPPEPPGDVLEKGPKANAVSIVDEDADPAGSARGDVEEGIRRELRSLDTGHAATVEVSPGDR
jgi:hypothetical protein